MTPVEEMCARLDELGIEHEIFDHDSGTLVRFNLSDGREVEYADFCWNETQLCVLGTTPEQAIAATVGRRDTMELWPEWEQVLFANVSDEVAQDNLNECVHELLDKAAAVGEECEMRICKRCGVAYELNIIDKGFGKHRFCPNCGGRCIG